MNHDKILKNRLWNARQLVKHAGGTNAAAAILGVRGAYVTAICGPNPNRTIGDRMAEKFERCFGLEAGALDTAPPEEASMDDPYISQMAQPMANCTEEDKQLGVAFLQWIAERSLARHTGVVVRNRRISLADETEALTSKQKPIPIPTKQIVEKKTPVSRKKTL